MQCMRCQCELPDPCSRGYCSGCIQHYREVQTNLSRSQRPLPGVCLDGKFTDDPSPRTFEREGKEVCGLCGSSDIESGYGLATGRGMGCYVFCGNCSTFLNFVEDPE